MNKKLKTPISELDIPLRVVNALETKSIFTVYDLLMQKPEDIKKISNVGERSLEKIFEALEKIGYFRESALTTSN